MSLKWLKISRSNEATDREAVAVNYDPLKMARSDLEIRIDRTSSKEARLRLVARISAGKY